MKLLDGVRADATLSLDGVYRYALYRDWFPKPNQQHLMFLMLNPSTADADQDDRTIRRCQEFARKFGFDGLTVANIFALRSTDPKVLYSHPDPIGPHNDEILETFFNAAGIGMVIAAWGVHGKLKNRGVGVLEIAARYGRDIHCLGVTKNGFPRHPLYLKGTTEPVMFRENN